MVFDFGQSLQGLVDTLAKFFPFFREILSAFPFPILDFFGWVIQLLLGFVIVRMIIRLIG